MTEIKFWNHERDRWEYGVSLWDGKHPYEPKDWATKGTISSYVPSENNGNGQLVSVEEGRAVQLDADSGGFRSTWKAA